MYWSIILHYTFELLNSVVQTDDKHVQKTLNTDYMWMYPNNDLFVSYHFQFNEKKMGISTVLTVNNNKENNSISR